jgi:hypothetical protein
MFRCLLGSLGCLIWLCSVDISELCSKQNKQNHKTGAIFFSGRLKGINHLWHFRPFISGFCGISGCQIIKTHFVAHPSVGDGECSHQPPALRASTSLTVTAPANPLLAVKHVVLKCDQCLQAEYSAPCDPRPPTVHEIKPSFIVRIWERNGSLSTDTC